MFSISSYFSVEYLLILLPLCILLYLMLPKTARRVTLLFFSYAFFWAVSGKLIVYLLAATLTVYAFGLWLGRILDAQKQALAACEKSEKKAVRSRYHTKLLRVVVLAVLLFDSRRLHRPGLVGCKLDGYAATLLGDAHVSLVGSQSVKVGGELLLAGSEEYGGKRKS